MENVFGKNIDPVEYYTGVERDAAREIAIGQRRVAAVSWARLVVVLTAIAGTWWLWGNVQAVTVLLLVCVVLFLALVKLHNRLFGALSMQQAIKQVATDGMKRISRQLDGLDGGDEYIDSRHCYSYDLDVFGRRSLFALINSTATPSGRERLARNLRNTGDVAGDIELRQEAVKELATMPDFLVRLQALGIIARDNDGKADADGQETVASVKLQWWQRVAVYFFPAVILLLVILALAGLDVAVYIETVAVVSLLAAAIGSKAVGRLHDGVEKIVNSISIYHDLLSEIEQRQFSASLLRQLQQRLGSGGEKSSVIAKKLARLLANLDQRYNWLSYVLLNILLQWDYRQAGNVLRWMARYSSKLDEWREVLGCIDELCALATFSFGNPRYVFPAIDRKGQVIVEARGLGHPLIAVGKCVCNDVDAMGSGNFMVVTGANMAGKSTYLRTVGVNYLLALVGAPVYASAMTVGVATLFTGLRTTDSLSDGESYFFAELRRLQSIVTRAASGERMLVILDEILRGTNSADKQKGSLALVGKLVGMNIAGIIATHDLVLGSLADRFPGKVFNRCFEATICDGTLNFDYTLHSGIAKNLNAYFLMQHMGIV